MRDRLNVGGIRAGRSGFKTIPHFLAILRDLCDLGGAISEFVFLRDLRVLGGEISDRAR